MRSTDKVRLTEDHAPQQSGASLLGPDRMVVLTCNGCNGSANYEYEWHAADPRNELIEALGVGECPGHGLRVQRTNGLLIPQDDKHLAQTDIKSAFLVAFATLGYRWATGAHISPIRHAIESGHLPPDGTCAIVRFDDDLEGDLVLELSEPVGAIAVRASSGSGVLFPAVGQQLAVLPRGRVALRSYRWPVTNGAHTQLSKAHESGSLFHMDLCRETHHA